MAASDSEIDVRDHGVPVHGNYTRAECIYCQKEVSGFSRLKQHLAGITGDVTACLQVPDAVKEQFKIQILNKKGKNMKKEVEAVDNPNLRLKRRHSTSNNDELEMSHPTISRGKKHAQGNSSRRICQDSPSPTSSYLSDTVQRCIARFFYETGTDLSIVESYGLLSLVSTVLSLGKRDIRISIPSFDDLKGFILLEECKEMEVRVNEIKSSWKTTGCSILVDGWRDRRGRDLINILVDCPKGPVFLRSLDISASSGSVDAMMLAFHEAILEVGADNVVQIVLSSTFPCMGDLTKEFVWIHKTIFWSVSSTSCIELMLEEIGKMDHTSCILNKARTVTEFIYSSRMILQLVRSHTSVSDLIKKDTKVRSTMPFLTLENIVSEKENLKKMLKSAEWISSPWASYSEAKRMADVVRDPSFWVGANVVVKATIPLVRALDLIHRDPEPQLGFIYEIMDRTKETIRKGLNKDEALYMPYWRAIDEIWNNCLHSDLHSAAYFLNPRLRYSTNFCADDEVTRGTFNSIFVLVKDENICMLIKDQLNQYITYEGAFGRDDAVQLSSSLSPVCWWSRYGQECPDLQQFAMRILSQTCDGATKYNLDRRAAEKLLTEGRNVIEQQILKEMTYLQYYFQLDSFVRRCRKGKQAEDHKSMNDGVIAETQGTLFITGECSNSRA